MLYQYPGKEHKCCFSIVSVLLLQLLIIVPFFLSFPGCFFLLALVEVLVSEGSDSCIWKKRCWIGAGVYCMYGILFLLLVWLVAGNLWHHVQSLVFKWSYSGAKCKICWSHWPKFLGKRSEISLWKQGALSWLMLPLLEVDLLLLTTLNALLPLATTAISQPEISAIVKQH